MKFLVVDSSKARFEKMQKMLNPNFLQGGSSAVQAINLAQAFQHTEKVPADFIFMNCSGSRNALAQIRQMRTMNRGTPLVVLLSSGQEMMAEECMKAGADDWVCHADLNQNLLARIVRYVMGVRKMNQAKMDFLNDISHQMRTSLHWAQGSVDLLKETGLTPQQKKLVQTFSLSSQRMMILLKNALGLSWAEFADKPLPSMPSHGASGKDDLKILVVDDDVENQKLVAAFTEKTKYRISYAKDGYEALNMSKNQCFDLILMDIEMPGMNGFETARMMKSLQACEKSKIMGLSANAFPKDVLNAKVQGFSGYVTKPINQERLLNSIAGCYKASGFYEPM